MKHDFSKDLLDTVKAVMSEKKLDPVNKDELKGTHAQRKDKDIDNDGDVDASDEYLHKRRKAVKKAIETNEATCADEGYISAAQRKAVWASRADDGKGHPDKKKKKSTNEEFSDLVSEGSMPTADEPTEENKKTANKLRALLDKEKKLKPIKLTKGWGDGGKSMKTSYGKMTKEEQEFIDALNNDMLEEIDIVEANIKVGDYTATFEKSKFHKNGYRPHLKNPQGKTSYLSDASYKTPEHAAGEAAAYHKGYTSGPGRASERGADNAVRAYRYKNKEHIHEEVELEEARGRPRKENKDFTIHPKTKEKLMHNNPAHMKRIENLQRTGALPKPKTEAGQNIITQLRKASTSMTGGHKVNFTHGASTTVSAGHAQKLLDKHAGMKPHEKESFQKDIGHSYERLRKHT